MENISETAAIENNAPLTPDNENVEACNNGFSILDCLVNFNFLKGQGTTVTEKTTIMETNPLSNTRNSIPNSSSPHECVTELTESKRKESEKQLMDSPNEVPQSLEKLILEEEPEKKIEKMTKDIEVLHLQGDHNRFLCSRNNSDIRLWMENQSQYSFVIEKSIRPLTKQLSRYIGVNPGGHTMRFAHLTDEILNKFCETTGEVLKCGQIFTKRVWSCWYPEKNPLSITEAWQWIIVDAIYRLDPSPQDKQSTKQLVKNSLTLLKRKYKHLNQKLKLLIERAQRGKVIVRKLKKKLKRKYVENSLEKNEHVINKTIPIRNSRPKYKTVRSVPVLRKDDHIVKCGEEGLLIKKVMGGELHFGSLTSSAKLEMFHLFIKQIVAMIDKSNEKLENALDNLSFVTEAQESHHMRKSLTLRHFEEIKAIIRNDGYFFNPSIKPLISSQIERMETEIKDIIYGAEGRISYFKLQISMASLISKNVSAIMKGKMLQSEKLQVLAKLKEFHMKIPSFPNSNLTVTSNDPQGIGLKGLNENPAESTTIIVDSDISGVAAAKSQEFTISEEIKTNIVKELRID